MSELRFELRQMPRCRLDLSALQPHRLRHLRLAQLRRLPLPYGNEQQPVAEWFRVTGRPRQAVRLRFEGGSPCFDGLGAGLEQGVIDLQGEAGDGAGREMRGGSLQIHGSAGAYAGAGMQGGTLQIHGSAGLGAAGALPGQALGMRGGFVHIHGDAGERAGTGMRRGLLLIQGQSGAACAADIRAGTVLVLQGIAPRAARNTALRMRRGTLLLGRAPSSLPATFHLCAEFEPVFLRLLWRQLASVLPPHWAGRTHPRRQPPVRVRKYAGDLAVAGQGEILILD